MRFVGIAFRTRVWHVCLDCSTNVTYTYVSESSTLLSSKVKQFALQIVADKNDETEKSHLHVVKTNSCGCGCGVETLCELFF